MLIGKDPGLQEVINAAGIIGATDVTALILGESGTGKELLARHIHDSSPRAAMPFVSVNCAALPEHLVESLLFGHIKGSFTGATSDHPGYIGAAQGGTLFLDEVAELPKNVQAKLLRFLESGEALPVGAALPMQADVRVVTATHRDLKAAMQAGRFREDLYYRLYVVPLELPALRDRQGDIPRLLDHFLGQLAVGHGVTAPRMSKAALACLQAYQWPGNVRELRNLCERLTILLPGSTVEPANLPPEFRSQPAPVRQAGSGFALPAEGIAISQLEQDLIRQALERTRGNRSHAARLLGMTRDTLLYRLKKFAIH